MVEWKKLGDICEIIRGNGVQKTDFVESGVGCIHYGQIYTHYGSFTYTTNKFVSKEVFEKARKASKGDIVMTDTSENVEDICKSVAYLGEEDIAVSNHALILKHKQNPKFLTYSTLTNSFSNQKRKFVVGAKVSGIKPENLARIKIYLPSLSEQSRIVSILDTFTAAIENLKEQIAQRRKQYEYYRDQLLDLEGKPGVEMKTLGELCEIKGRIGFRGYTREDQVEKGEGAISLSPGNIINGIIDYNSCTYITWEKYEESPEIMTLDGDIILCKTASVGKVAMVMNLPEKATINPQLVVLKNIKIANKYLYYQLSTFKIQAILKGLAGIGSVPNISQAKLADIKICISSTDEQQRIVSILDTFEASISNLEAQLKERQKQYEYYRNKLLTFE